MYWILKIILYVRISFYSFGFFFPFFLYIYVFNVFCFHQGVLSISSYRCPDLVMAFYKSLLVFRLSSHPSQLRPRWPLVLQTSHALPYVLPLCAPCFLVLHIICLSFSFNVCLLAIFLTLECKLRKDRGYVCVVHCCVPNTSYLYRRASE